MDPITIIVILVVVELASGGVSGAVGATAGAVADGAKAAAKETADGVAKLRDERAKELAKTKKGRAQLAGEERRRKARQFATRGIKAGVKALPGGAKSGWRRGRQVRRDAIAKVADGGRHAIDVARGKLPLGRQDERGEARRLYPLGGYVPDESPGGPDELVPHAACNGKGCEICGGDGEVSAWSQDPKFGVIPRAEQGQWRQPGDGLADPRVEITDERVHADDFTYATDTELRGLAAAGNRAANRELIRRTEARRQDMNAMGGCAHIDPETDRMCGRGTDDKFCDRHQQSPATGGGEGDAMPQMKPANTTEAYRAWCVGNGIDPDTGQKQSPAQGGGESTTKSKGEHVSEAVVEDKGAGPYVDGWEGEADGYETAVAFWEAKRDRLRASADVNQRHEIGGVDATLSALDAVVEALRGANEAHSGHATALRERWSAELLTQMNATGAESAQEVAGAR
jgi:hypothetical protein